MKAARLLCLAALLTAASPAAANPFDEFGFGARSVALAGAVSATARDVSATYYNPAGLAAADGLTLELGYVHLQPRLELNGGDLDVARHSGLTGGLLLPGRAWGRRFAVALGLFLPDDRITRVRSLPQQQPRFVLYDNRPQRLMIMLSAAAEPIKGLFVGVTLSFLSNTQGTLAMRGQVSLTDPGDTTLLSDVDVDFPAIRYPSFGLLWTPSKHWRIAATWREPFRLKLALGVDVAGDVVLTSGPAPVPVVRDGSFVLTSLNNNLYSPRQAVVGLAWRNAGWTVGADVAWLQWSRFPAPASLIGIELDLEGLDFAVPPPDAPEAPDFEDIFVPRVGIEWRALTGDVGVLFRTGWFFQPSPAPEQRGLTNYADADRHGVALGAGVEIGGLQPILAEPLVIDLALQLIQLVPRDARKLDPADPVGDWRASGHLFGGALNARLQF